MNRCKNIAVIGFINIYVKKFSQNIIDKCPCRKYTYSELKHIYKIGFKAHDYGSINYELW